MNTQESNKIIALFMGADQVDYGMENMYSFKDKQCLYSLPALEYHTSWAWLMPVVEQIEALGYLVYMQPDGCQILTKNGNWPDTLIIDADFRHTRLENTYEGVVSFIQWYNTHNKK